VIGRLTLLMLLALSLGQATAGDQIREQENAAEIAKQPLIGKSLWLEVAGQRFFCLYTESEKTDNAQAAIILHDIGGDPDQKPLLHELRTQLPQHNWTTLALQLPLREKSATEADYYGLFAESQLRIRAAVAYLQKSGAKKIALIGYGLGALQAVYAVNEKPEAIVAVAAISLPVPESDVPQAQTLAYIKNIALPLLDIYAEFDLPLVLNTAQERRLAGKDNPVFWQVRMEGENHAYQQDYERLVKRVYSWLSANSRQN
jgi:pimeloyl-ACP methyl ester carboxylesterase